MKVRDLISKLQELDGDMDVKIDGKDLTLRNVDEVDVWELQGNKIPSTSCYIVVL